MITAHVKPQFDNLNHDVHRTRYHARPMDHVTVTISRGLTEQLAGVDRKGVEEKRQRRAPRSKSDRDTLAFLKEKEEVREALLRSRRVGKLLLKREEEEAHKIEAQAKELAQHPAMQSPGVDVCQQQRKAVEQCCREQAESVLSCRPLIDAYASCTNKTFMDHLQRTQHNDGQKGT